jgi:HrpA-like RNA helicase
VALVFSFRAFQQERRKAAAWKRVGSCSAVGSSDTVTCTGVQLVKLRLPPSFAACQVIRAQNEGRCEATVNVEALQDFQAAVDQIAFEGLGRHVTAFGTLNRRRCKDARTGKFIAGCISKHSYGIAVDVRPFADNARWDEVVSAEPGAQRVIDIFRSHHFTWGMTFRSNPDPQHVEWQPH